MCRKASGSAIERSTWVSAAKLTMASTPWAASHDGLPVADVGLKELVAGIVFYGPQIVEVAGVGELVQVDDLGPQAGGEQPADEGAADEAGAAADEEPHRLFTPQS